MAYAKVEVSDPEVDLIVKETPGILENTYRLPTVPPGVWMAGKIMLVAVIDVFGTVTLPAVNVAVPVVKLRIELTLGSTIKWK